MEMVSLILQFAFYLLIAAPLCLAAHELGHASMILLWTQQKVRFQFGKQGRKWEAHLGRLTLTLHGELSALWFGRYYLEDKTTLSRSQDFWITLGGPLVSFLLSLAYATVWLATSVVDPWRMLAVLNLIVFLNTSLPRYHPEWQGAQAGLPSDGLQLVQLFRQPDSHS